ncbi:MAG: LCP family protein [Selenomonadaceae bacterium]
MAHANTTRSVRQNRKKKRSWLKIISLLFVLAAFAGALFASSGFFDNPKSTATEGMLVAKDKATIMIMGVDERDDDVGRSDTLMVATIDPKKDQAALLSIPRDTRVKIKGHGFDKINAAYAYGGHKLARETVENFLGTPMDHYVIINIRAFQRIIDAIGGIDIDVEKRMYYEDPWDDDGGLLIDLRPGMQHMDGKTAVTYVRYRDEEGDIGRISRQQKFMKALMDKMTSPSIIPQIPTIIKEISSSIKTDMSVREMLEFAGTLREAQKNGLKTDMVPGRPLYIEEISYWIPDITKLRSTIANTLGISMNSSMRSAMEREQSEYENSIPSGATEVPATDTSVGKLRPSIKEDTSTKNNKTTDTKKSGDTKKSPDSDSGDRKSQPADTTDSTPASTSTSVPPRTTSSPSAPRIGDNTGKTQ